MSFSNRDPNETPFEYIGSELAVFSHAVNWKRYWRSWIAAYITGDVLEVGAGIGATTKALCSLEYESWLSIEPDAAMVRDLQQQQAAGEFPGNCRFRVATVQDLASTELFDSILYIDVLEHIENDQDELRCAAAHLKPGGYLIVLGPAFQFLYTPFDRAIGHYRRYTRPKLHALTPPSCQIADSFYLDAAGMMASMGNLLLLRASQPTYEQIHFWDTYLVRISRVVDRLTGCRFGRSVVCIWRQTLA